MSSARAKLIVQDFVTLLREQIGFIIESEGASHRRFREVLEASVDERLAQWKLAEATPARHPLVPPDLESRVEHAPAAQAPAVAGPISSVVLDAAVLVECATRFAALSDVYGPTPVRLAAAHLRSNLGRESGPVLNFLLAAIALLDGEA